MISLGQEVSTLNAFKHYRYLMETRNLAKKSFRRQLLSRTYKDAQRTMDQVNLHHHPQTMGFSLGWRFRVTGPF